ncbi:MFS transporter [Paenibacillus sp. JX-17]|uniref:MFS transporter n=1 Tax=Paenibacillus lacisoli TaxID=3064525 RepID=A0ABT9CEP0_9BACL|nr:MFS transporter [Paenibacillus sp. JX-17]MDO7907104.1 MFS transporter [Paenibacillus sp. JX-17]
MATKHSTDLRIVRNILFLLFALPGLSFASWVSQTPAVRDLLQISTSEMGIIIFAIAAGSMIGLLGTGTVIARKGARWVIMGSSLLILTGFVITGAGITLKMVPVVIIGLLVFGCGYGSAEVGLNVEGSAVEKALNRTLLPAFHGFFSVGTLAGAAIGAGAVAVHLPIIAHFSILALLIAAAILYCYRYLPGDTGKEQASSGEHKASSLKQQFLVFKEKRTLLIGIIVLGMAFAEGSANDWLPLTMVDGYDVSSLTGTFVYGLFVAAMTLGRFAGGWVLDRYGRVPVLGGCASAAVIGIALVIWGQHYLIASVGVVLWGLGASLGFPVGLSAAGDEPKGAAARVGAVAATGYLAFLAGPPFLGFLGEHYGLLRALIIVLIGVIAAGVLSKAASPLGHVRNHNNQERLES